MKTIKCENKNCNKQATRVSRIDGKHYCEECLLKEIKGFINIVDSLPRPTFGF